MGIKLADHASEEGHVHIAPPTFDLAEVTERFTAKINELSSSLANMNFGGSAQGLFQALEPWANLATVGEISEEERARRRAKAKAQRKARRANRG